MSPRQVYDFLYVDVKRIARLVAQLDGKGILQETTRELTTGGEGGAKLNLGFWEVTFSPKMSGSSGGKYDPSWRLPVVFLDYMQHHIVGDPAAWEIGQIVTLTGSIAFYDFAFAAESLKVDRVRNEMRADGTSLSQCTDDSLQQFRNAADALPHMLQALITDGSVTTWSTVNDAYMTASTGDLTLKCGETIEGRWAITGILDAMIDQSKTAGSIARSAGFSREFASFGAAVRSTIGRPASCYGVTPLTIHRKVEVPKSSGNA